MEPADLNHFAPDDARLDARLRQPAPALPDDGFSDRVLAALPPEAGHARSRRRLMCGAGAAAGVLFAAIGFALRPATPANEPGIAAELAQAGQFLFDPVLGVALLVTALSLLYVFRGRLRFDWAF